jgi:SHS2 domain-containing protein
LIPESEFRFLEHTADVQIECRAPTLAPLLEVAAQALYAVTLRRCDDQADITRTVNLQAGSREELLVNWLNELIFLLDTEGFVATAITFERATGRFVSAHLRGYTGSADDREMEVKAATYHDIEITRTKEGLVARFVLDL